MRRGFLILTCLAPFVTMAEEEPRISELLPVAGIPQMDATIADAEGDGDLDLFFVNTPFNGANTPAAVWIENKGRRNFGNPRVISYRHGFYEDFDYDETPIDIDGDGRMDLFVQTSHASLTAATYAVLVDQSGKAIRREQLGTPGPSSWKAMDLGKNRKMTLLEIIPPAPDQKSTVKFWQKNGESGLTPWTSQILELPVTPTPYTILAHDFDGDHDLDLIFAGDYSPTDKAYLFKRTGETSFATEPEEIALNQSFPIAWADLDGDGDDDPYSFYTSSFEWQVRGEASELGTTQRWNPNPEGTGTWKLIGISSSPGHGAILSFTHQVYDHENNDTLTIRQFRFGTWEEIKNTVVSQTGLPGHREHQWSVIGFRDLDGDGFTDAMLAAEISPNTYSNSGPIRVGVAWGKSSGFEPIKWIADPPFRSGDPIPADFDGDSDLDIVAGPDVTGRSFLLKNDGKGNFNTTRPLRELLPSWLAKEEASAFILASADLDGNGRPDLIVRYERKGQDPANPDSGITTAFNTGNGTFSVPGLQRAAQARNRNRLTWIARAFLKDLRDLRTGTKKWNQLSWPPVINEQELRAIPIFSNTMGKAPSQIVEFSDMDGDGDLDAILPEGWQENIRGKLTTQHSMLAGTTIPDLFGNPLPIAWATVGDLDGDNRPDFVANYYGNNPPSNPTFDPETYMGIAYGDGRGGASTILKVEVDLIGSEMFGGYSWGRALIGDIDGDGLNDLITEEPIPLDPTTFETFGLRWRRNPGGGSRDPNTWVVADLPLPVFEGLKRIDFDGDGAPEWVTAKKYLKATPDGIQPSAPYNFSHPVNLYPAARAPHIIADFDGDGDADFVYLGNDVGPGCHLSLVRNTIIDERVPKPAAKLPVKGRNRR